MGDAVVGHQHRQQIFPGKTSNGEKVNERRRESVDGREKAMSSESLAGCDINTLVDVPASRLTTPPTQYM